MSLDGLMAAAGKTGETGTTVAATLVLFLATLVIRNAVDESAPLPVLR
jgi:hypothetical protein